LLHLVGRWKKPCYGCVKQRSVTGASLEVSKTRSFKGACQDLWAIKQVAHGPFIKNIDLACDRVSAVIEGLRKDRERVAELQAQLAEARERYEAIRNPAQALYDELCSGQYSQCPPVIVGGLIAPFANSLGQALAGDDAATASSGNDDEEKDQ